MPSNWMKNVSLALWSFVFRPAGVQRINLLTAKGSNRQGLVTHVQWHEWTTKGWHGRNSPGVAKGTRMGMRPCGKGGKGEEVKKRRTEAIGTGVSALLDCLDYIQQAVKSSTPTAGESVTKRHLGYCSQTLWSTFSPWKGCPTPLTARRSC